MPKNQVQFQRGYSLPDFLREYGREEQCRAALFRWRWPQGFSCPGCGYSGYCTLQSRFLYQCHRCHRQTSLISGTLFESTKLPLTTWFLAIYLLTQAKSGLSALALKRQLGISYNAAWRVKHKLMQVMKEREEGSPLRGLIQLDDAYWGGQSRGGKRGRGAPKKTPFVAAVSTNDGHPRSMRLSRLKGFRKAEVAAWSAKHLHEGAHVVSDGLGCFAAVTKAGCTHEVIITGGGPCSVTLEAFTWVNTILGNVKNAIHGTYHAVAPKHLPRYLAEFSYRFNRRFQLKAMVPRLGYAAVRTPPMPQRLLKLAEAGW